ncbi:DUF4296 domain-containing protein [Bacteroides sp.]
MKKNFRFRLCCFCLIAFTLAGCKVKRPKEVLSETKMENLLYDYHIAKAMGEDLPYNDNYKKALYVESVFKKHGTTEAVFDSSLVWYTRNTELLSKIYEKVNKRLKSQRDQINHLIAIRDKKPQLSAPGDSIDVWAWNKISVLNSTPLNNKLTFTLPADSNFKKKDVLVWEVCYHFLNKATTEHPVIMAMQIIYDNDSTASISKTRNVLQSGKQIIRLESDTVSIKEIKGFIYYPQGRNLSSVLADQISLTRYHSNDSLSAAADSLKADSLSQVVKEDSIRKKAKPDTIQTDTHQRSNPSDLNRPSDGVRTIKPEQRATEEKIQKEKQELERQQRANQRRRPIRR